MWGRYKGTSKCCLRHTGKIPQQPLVLLFPSNAESRSSLRRQGGAAGPLISHSWLTVKTDFSCPRAFTFKSFHTTLSTHTHNWLPGNKVIWIEKFVIIVKSTGAHSSEAAGGCRETPATPILYWCNRPFTTRSVCSVVKHSLKNIYR